MQGVITGLRPSIRLFDGAQQISEMPAIGLRGFGKGCPKIQFGVVDFVSGSADQALTQAGDDARSRALQLRQ